MSKKQAIFLNATRLFSQKGYKDTSMAELARATGSAGGTIFYHFKTKEELFVSILKNVKETIIHDFNRYLEESRFENGLEMVEGAISFYLNRAVKMEDHIRLLHRHYPYELARVNPVCRQHLEAIYECFLDMFEQAITQGQKDGSIGNRPARKLALIIYSMVDGLVRFNTYNLYDAGALYDEVIESCRRMLKNS
ncbi:MAG: TetR/AcrR family transcriptional regulator [Desulfobacterales bacterium]|jgi:AcrR family transcriptional regulator